MKKAIILLSGGLDSAVTAAIAKEQGYSLYCLTVDYGQTHKVEIACSHVVADFLKARQHIVLRIEDFNKICKSDLLQPGQKGNENVPTYVPARNMILLSLALSWAESINAESIYIGIHQQDSPNYPDCSTDFLARFCYMRRAAVMMNNPPFTLAPLLNMSKAEIIKKGMELNIDFAITNSCYHPKKCGRPCGKCPACIIRNKAFKEVGK